MLVGYHLCMCVVIEVGCCRCYAALGYYYSASSLLRFPPLLCDVGGDMVNMAMVGVVMVW